MYFSDEMHLIKEDAQAFHHMLSDIQKKPEECVFIDDKESSLIPARQIGISTILFESPEKLRKGLIQLGVL